MRDTDIDIKITPEQFFDPDKVSDSFGNPFKEQIGGQHYKKLAIQPVEYTLANQLGFCEGSAIKYITRWRDKNGIQDLEKAIHMLRLLIEHEKNDNTHS